MLGTPILFLIFNRPDATKIVFEKIRAVRPKELFVASDGPRKEKAGEIELCIETRKIIYEVDWDCDVYTLFREDNLGCKVAVSSAINWFFDHVEEGIILEDDCDPDPSFFDFCSEMLKRYRHDTRIMSISGTNFLQSIEYRFDYFFSRFYSCWGWATWKRVWKMYDIEMKEFEIFMKNDQINYFFNDKNYIKYCLSQYSAAYRNLVNSWAIPMSFTILLNNGLNIIPKYNLIMNKGIGGTHYTTQGYSLKEVKSIKSNNFSGPQNVYPDYSIERLYLKKLGSVQNSAYRTIINNIKKKLYPLYSFFVKKIKTVV